MTNRSPRPVADEEMDAYAATHSTQPSEQLDVVARATRDWSEHPGMMVDAAEGKLLALMVSLTGARRILEVGTFTGYSAISMAEALPADGHITTLELSPEHAAKAAEHIELAGASDRISIMVGNAIDSLGALRGPYDLAFIDADKPAYPAYFEAVVPLMRPGGLIIADNVLRSGRVLDVESPDPGIVGMREFNDKAVADPRVEAVMLTVRDGITFIRVRD
jgi:caffeoyl-CoA O-methyltransferase